MINTKAPVIFIMNLSIFLIVFVTFADAIEQGPYPDTSSEQGRPPSDYAYKPRNHRTFQPQRSQPPHTREKNGLEHSINQIPYSQTRQNYAPERTINHTPYSPKSEQKQTINSYAEKYPVKQPDIRQREHGYIGNSRPRDTEEIPRRRIHQSAKQIHTTSTRYKHEPAESMQSDGFPFNYRGFPYNYFGFPYGNKYKYGYQAEAFPMREHTGK